MSNRKDHWETIYTSKDTHQVGWYQESPVISIQMLNRICATKEQSVLDVGAGASVLVDELIKLGYRDISLLDISAAAFTVVKERLGKNSDIPDYYISDVTSFEVKRRFDIWHDRAVFHFLTVPEDRKKYIACMNKLLSRDGRVIIGTFSLNGPTQCSGLDIVQYDKNKMANELGDGFKIIETHTDVHTTPGGKKQEFMYFIIRRAE
ncbi:MAG: class I SAM-dependent methyltransferase [Gammaproteobacteria bacterium]|nr:class I SAM-dependent methyltransferase [Gammaproteobacteria bacterium]